jgi:hypothetical protein
VPCAVLVMIRHFLITLALYTQTRKFTILAMHLLMRNVRSATLVNVLFIEVEMTCMVAQ